MGFLVFLAKPAIAGLVKWAIGAAVTYFIAKPAIEKWGSTPANRAEQAGVSKLQLYEDAKKRQADKKKYYEEKNKEVLDEIKELKDKLDKLLGRNGKKELIEQLKTATPEEREEVRKQLREQANAEYEATSKVLRDSLDKSERRNIQLAKELQEAKNNGNTGQVAKISTMMKDMEKQNSIIRLNLQKVEKAKKENQQIIDQYVQNIEKPWYQDMNFKSPWLWGIFLMSFIIFYILYKALVSGWSKAKEIFSGE